MGRNIPACAGKTSLENLFSLSIPEHPRVRGENSVGGSCFPVYIGTSPRARGKPFHHLRRGGGVRNIPACAGKTDGTVFIPVLPEEHPRVRGENLIIESHKLSPSGTSPRARGKRMATAWYASLLRNIPACAGKTIWAWGQCFENQEHPRVRGENIGAKILSVISGGTSPRARGKHQHSRPRRGYCRNIPACAGKTATSKEKPIITAEHPRVRGENRAKVLQKVWA